MFNKLPVVLFDKIFQYTDVKDIVNFTNTNKEHQKIINNITSNKKSLIQKTFKMENNICDIKSWIFLQHIDYKLENSKQYYDIFKNIHYSYKLDLNNFLKIFDELTKLLIEDFEFEINKDKQEQYNYLLYSIFELFKNHINIFNIKNHNDNLLKYILNFLLKIYNDKIHFINNDKIFIYIKQIFQIFFNDINDININIYELFIFTYLQKILLISEYDEKLLDFLYNLIGEYNLDYYFLIPEN